MPYWLQIIVWISGGLLAVGVIWKKLLQPLGKLVGLIVELLPLLRAMIKAFEGNPNAFAVLNEIVSQFKTDSGSSLRDAIDRLETAVEHLGAAALESKGVAAAAKEAADFLKIGVEAKKQVDEIDRATMRRLEVLLDRLGVKVDEGAATGMRIEHAAGVVAEDLAAANKLADKAGGN